MSLTLTQEQQLSSALHWIINQSSLHNSTVSDALNAIVIFIDSDIRSQAGTVYTTPAFIGRQDNSGK